MPHVPPDPRRARRERAPTGAAELGAAVRTDPLTAAGLLVAAYLAPAKARPAAGIAVAVALSRLHGRGLERLERRFVDLFAQRTSVGRAVRLLEERLEDVELVAADVGLAVAEPRRAAHRRLRERILTGYR